MAESPVILNVMLPKPGFIEWLFETWAWLLHHHDAETRYTGRALVTPTRLDFPVDALAGEELAEDYFLFVQEHAQLSSWPLHVLPDHEFLHGEAGEKGFPIPYDPTWLADPARLITHFARGIAHYAVHSIADEIPGDVEYVIDATAVYLGFGVFCANSASPRASGDNLILARRLGAMAEHELAYALAVFGVLLEIPDREMERHLRPNPRAFHRKAVKHVLRNHGRGLDRLRGVYPKRVGPYR